MNWPCSGTSAHIAYGRWGTFSDADAVKARTVRPTATTETRLRCTFISVFFLTGLMLASSREVPEERRLARLRADFLRPFIRQGSKPLLAFLLFHFRQAFGFV